MATDSSQQMPAYYSVRFGYRRSMVRPGFVRRFYDALFGDGFEFKSVFAWGCSPDLTLGEILAWNETRLRKDFSLGFTEHVSNNYRQIMLDHPAFSECRVLVLNSSRACELIVPESEMRDVDSGKIATRLQSLEDLAARVWSTGQFGAIQTAGELDDCQTCADLERGRAACIDTFGWLDSRCRERQKLDRFDVTPLPDGAAFLRARGPVE